MHIPTSIDDVLSEDVLADLVCLAVSHCLNLAVIEKVVIEPLLSLILNLLLFLTDYLPMLHRPCNLRVVLHMRVNHECSQCIILLLIHLVLYHREDIETGQYRLCQVDIISEIECIVVGALEGVGCGDDGTTGLEGGDNTCLGDRDGLLLHGLMYGCPILIVHLIELVDEAQPLVSEDERATLQRPLTSDRVLVHARRQTHCGGTLASGVHAAVEDLLDVLKELRLGSTGVSKKQHIDITTNSVLSVDVLGLTSKHG